MLTKLKNNIFLKFFIVVFGILCSCSLSAETKIAFLGDSLTKGHGISPEDAFPRIIETMLQENGFDVKVLSSGVSGATTATGLARLQSVMRYQPQIVMIELGANDGLKGRPVPTIRANLDAMIRYAKEQGAQVILAGMKLPPTYTKTYRTDYEAMFPELAAEHEITLIPFILEGIAYNRDLNLPDGFHPNEQGHQIMAQTIYMYIEPLVPVN